MTSKVKLQTATTHKCDKMKTLGNKMLMRVIATLPYRRRFRTTLPDIGATHWWLYFDFLLVFHSDLRYRCNYRWVRLSSSSPWLFSQLLCRVSEEKKYSKQCFAIISI